MQSKLPSLEELRVEGREVHTSYSGKSEGSRKPVFIVLAGQPDCVQRKFHISAIQHLLEAREASCGFAPPLHRIHVVVTYFRP